MAIPDYLRQAYENEQAAEKNLNHANLRVRWLERRALDAPTGNEFNFYVSELDKAQEEARAAGVQCFDARYKLLQAQYQAQNEERGRAAL